MKRFFTLILVVAAVSSSAQFRANYGRFDSIPFLKSNGDTLTLSTAGGMDSPQFSQVDLNGDGKADLFVFERNGKTIRPFINVGKPNKTEYRFAPMYIQHFPPLREMALMRDYNKDGKADLFTQSRAGVAGMAAWKNVTGASDTLSFEKVEYFYNSISKEYVDYMVSDIYGNRTNIYLSPGDIPGIEDIDGDGDLDILNFGNWGNVVEYHKNLSVELTGGFDTLVFEMETGCWGHFYENSSSNSVTFGHNCKGGGGGNAQGSNPRHVGSTLLPLDLDDDGDKDMILGDIGYPNLLALFNTGSQSNAVMTSMDSTFPSGDVPVDLFIFPGAFHLDVNNDNTKEIIAAPNTAYDGVNYNNVWLYENKGTSGNPDFTRTSNNFMVDEMVDVGSDAHPVFFDANADGLQDLLIGNYGYRDQAGNYTGGIAYYKNTGDSSFPNFTFVTDDYMGIKSHGLLGLHPAIGDVDDDGDQDMIIGDYDGELHYYENTASMGNPANFASAALLGLDSIDVGQFAAPQLADLNNDGTLDLLIGERNGTLNFVKNSGSKTSAMFLKSDIQENFGKIKHQNFVGTGYTTPYMVEMDTSGKMNSTLPSERYIFVGTESGFVYIYQVTNDLFGKFPLKDSLYTAGFKTSVTAGDLNHDSIADLAFGEAPGGIGILIKGRGIQVPAPPKPEEPIEPGVTEDVNNNDLLKVFPNPANDEVYVFFDDPRFANGTLKLFDMQGSEIMKQSIAPDAKQVPIDASDLAPGLYLIFMRGDKIQTYEKLIIK